MLKHLLITALALGVATWVVPGITLTQGWTLNGVLSLIGVAIVFGIVNAVIKPLFKAVTGCFVLITFGLFLLVINACMMLLTSYLCGKLGLGWGIEGTTQMNTLIIGVEGGLVVAVVSFLAGKLLGEGHRG